MATARDNVNMEKGKLPEVLDLDNKLQENNDYWEKEK